MKTVIGAFIFGLALGLLSTAPASATQYCGGIAGIPCSAGLTCVDDPNDGCDPDCGGADCQGICVVDEMQFCGGFAGVICADGQVCADTKGDFCSNLCGGVDCGGMCVSIPSADTDNDGVLDEADLCGETPAGDVVDANGCSVDQAVTRTIDTIYELIDVEVSEKALDKLYKAQDKLSEAQVELDEGDVNKALRKIRDAAKELIKAGEEGSEVDELIAVLVESARTQAELAIEAAIAAGEDADPNRIANALEELVKADEDLANGEPDKAIGHFAKAWEHAKKALS